MVKKLLLSFLLVFSLGTTLMEAANNGIPMVVNGVDRSEFVVAWDLHKVVFTQPKGGMVFPGHGYQCQPIPETVKIIKQLHANGVKQVVLSNISSSSFAKLRRSYPDIFSCFDLSSSLADASLFKRKPFGNYMEVFIRKNRGVRRHKILFFDDKKRNLDGAFSYGIRTHLFTTPASARNVLQQTGLL